MPWHPLSRVGDGFIYWRGNFTKSYFYGSALKKSRLMATMKKEIDNFDFHGIYNA